MNKYFRNILKWFFLLLFLEFFCSITFFNHAHTVDGIIIVHSHPYKHTHNAPGHTHPLNGYLLIDLLTHFIALSALAVLIDAVYRRMWKQERMESTSGPSIISFREPNYFRGPPVTA